jgi:hypothetical protein
VPQVIQDWGGIKVGIFAVIEDGWMATLTCDISNFVYTSYVDVAKKICEEFKSQGVQLIICLTHMRYTRFATFPEPNLLPPHLPRIRSAHGCLACIRRIPRHKSRLRRMYFFLVWFKIGSHPLVFSTNSGIVRLPEDLNLAKNVPEINLVLGGHDHFTHHGVENGVVVVKSGHDFRWLTKVDVKLEGGKPIIKFEKIDIVASIPE